MRITEPMTMITDYLMGALALVLAVRLLRDGVAPGQTSVRLWALALLMTATASFVGGSYHGFIELLPAPTAASMCWLTTPVATKTLFWPLCRPTPGSACWRPTSTASFTGAKPCCRQ